MVKVKVSVSINLEQLQWLSGKANQDETSVSHELRQVLKKAMEEDR